MKKQIIATTVSLILGGTLLQTALAENNTMLMLIDALYKSGSINPEAYEALRKSAKTDIEMAKVDLEKQKLEKEKASASELEFSTKDGLKVQTKDKKFKFQFGGRLMADAAFFNNDKGSGLNDGTEFRRARFYAKGTLYNDWLYKLQYDFTGSGTSGIRDAYIKYTGLKPWGMPLNITAGNFKQSFGLSELTSSRFITMMERPMVLEAFAPSRKMAFGLGTHGNDWTANISAHGDSVSTSNTTADEGRGTIARITYGPKLSESTQIHLGLAGGYEVPQNNKVQFKSRPEAHLANHRLLDTGTISNVNNYTLFGAEAAVVFGPFSLQSEYMRADLTRDGGNKDATFDGYYATASYFLTGESRNYIAKKGVFGRVKPNRNFDLKGGWGAWELATRFSNLDLNDSGINGGEIDTFSAGINWYANPHVRFMANYVNVLNLDGGLNLDGKNNDAQEPDLVEFRAQLDF